MSNEVAIKIENLGKRYRYGNAQSVSSNLRADLTDWARGVFRRNRCQHGGTYSVASAASDPATASEKSPVSHPTLHQIHENHLDADPSYFWALKDINLEVRQGEVIGIIGRNGAGKSTLLKILSRITPPTTGKITYNGRIASLLEVGTGFHRELTGRENIFLNGSILGMKRAEIAKKFDEIVAFAEVEKFIDTPVKFYSSGMYMRLAFAVAAHLEPEILLVDEVLAVGDASFQKKCLGKMGDVAKQGRTILFVSHNMGAIVRLCSRCFWLDHGHTQLEGIPSQVISAYLQQGLTGEAERQWLSTDRPGDDTLRLCAVRICQPSGVLCTNIDITLPLEIEIETETLRPLEDVAIALLVMTGDGLRILHTADIFNGTAPARKMGRCITVCQLPAYTLNTGSFLLTVAADIPNIRVIFCVENVLTWTVEAVSAEMGKYSPGAWTGIIGPGLARWFTK